MGGPLGPMVLIFASPVKTCTDFLVKNSDIDRAILTVISINGHHCAIKKKKQTCFGRHFLTKYFVFKFYFKNVSAFMFLYFEPNFIDKFIRESGFSNFLVT